MASITKHPSRWGMHGWASSSGSASAQLRVTLHDGPARADRLVLAQVGGPVSGAPRQLTIQGPNGPDGQSATGRQHQPREGEGRGVAHCQTERKQGPPGLGRGPGLPSCVARDRLVSLRLFVGTEQGVVRFWRVEQDRSNATARQRGCVCPASTTPTTVWRCVRGAGVRGMLGTCLVLCAINRGVPRAFTTSVVLRRAWRATSVGHRRHARRAGRYYMCQLFTLELLLRWADCRCPFVLHPLGRTALAHTAPSISLIFRKHNPLSNPLHSRNTEG